MEGEALHGGEGGNSKSRLGAKGPAPSRLRFAPVTP